MKHTPLAFFLVVLAAQAQADSGGSSLWSNLWRNADQRAEAMLQQGDASGAAKAYADPRRKAYAQFKAGDYGAAAHELSAFDDSEAHYNRGNALAYAGDLQGALKAYDAALKLDPKSQDARHNRDLVAKALAQQQQKKDAEKSKPQDGKQESNKDDRQNAKQGSKQDDQQGGGQGSKPDGKQSDKPGGRQDAQQGGKADGKRADQAQSPSSAQKPATAGQSDKQNSAAQDKAQAAGTSDAEQARRDVNASMKDVQQGQTGGAARDAAGEDRNAPASSSPLTEKQIAQEQWLRSIPDDPGGLLRRKFLIEHMMRQRDAKP